MPSCRKVFGVSHSNLAVRLSALADFLCAFSLSWLLLFILQWKCRDIAFPSAYSLFERIVRTSPIVILRIFATEFKLKTTGPSVSTINHWKHWNFHSSASDAEFWYSFLSYYSYRWKIRRTCIQLIPMYCTLFLNLNITFWISSFREINF